MLDIHNHCLFGIDDGAGTIDEAARLLKVAEEDGVSSVILTPHYSVLDGFIADYDTVENLKKELEERLKEDGINITLYTGNELFIHDKLDQMLDDKAVHTLAGSHYVLVEFPMDRYRDEYDEILYNMRISGYWIIIAHPERYAYVQKDPSFVCRWTDYGYYLQANTDSLKVVKKEKVIDYLIKRRILHFIASDAHGVYRPAVLSGAYKYITANYSKEVADRLFKVNPEKIISNQRLDEMPEVKGKGIFDFLFR